MSHQSVTDPDRLEERQVIGGMPRYMTACQEWEHGDSMAYTNDEKAVMVVTCQECRGELVKAKLGIE